MAISEKAVFIRNLHKRPRPVNQTDQSDPTDQSDTHTESYALYKPYIEEKSPETAANTLICLIHQANFLIDQLIRRLQQTFLEEGGFTEKLHAARSDYRRRKQFE